MTSSSVIEKLEGFSASALEIHKKSVKFKLNPEGADALFESVASKLNSIRTGIFKKLNFQMGDFEYKKPNLEPIIKDETEAKAEIKSQLSTLAATIEKFRDTWKNSKYRLVDASANKVDYLGNPEKGVMTKLITDLQNLRELY